MISLDVALPQLKAYFAEQPEVVLAYLYGSYAVGQVHGDSDLDIGVLFSEGIVSKRQVRLALRYTEEIKRLIGERVEVDVRELNHCPVAFKMQVIRPGRCIYAVNGRERARFEAEVIINYLDFKPVLDLYYDMMSKQIGEGSTLYGLEFRNRLTATRQPASTKGAT